MSGEIDEIQELYNYFLDEAVKLTHYYNFKTPLEIFCLYYFLVENYLIRKDITGYYPEIIETANIAGVYVILNGGLCRHRSFMLNDLYKKCMIYSVILLGFSKNLLKFHAPLLDRNRKETSKYINLIQQKIAEGDSLEEFEDILKMKKIKYSHDMIQKHYYYTHPQKPNHAIVMAGINERNYLDPMIGYAYHINNRDRQTLCNHLGNYFFFDYGIHKYFFDFYYGLETDFDLTYNTILRKECPTEQETVQKTIQLYGYLQDNKEGMELFMKDKKEIIEDIHHKILSLQR